MAKLYEIIDLLNKNIPFDIKEEWDNVGLIIGDRNKEINKILIALDCTYDVLLEAIKIDADLIITHHPLIFGGIKNIDFNTPLGIKIRELIRSEIDLISLHTNFDKVENGTSDTLSKILGLKNIQNLTDDEFSLGKIGETDPVSLKAFISFVKEKLNLDFVKYIGNDEKVIKKVAVVSGSGCEFYIDAKQQGADLLITSEIKHHIGIEAMESDIALIDAGHFETENVALKTLKNMLEELVPDTRLSQDYTKLFKRG